MGSVRTAGYAIGEDRTSPRLEAIAGIRQRSCPRLAPSPCRLPGPIGRYGAVLPQVFTATAATQHPPSGARYGVRGRVCGAGARTRGLNFLMILYGASVSSVSCRGSPCRCARDRCARALKPLPGAAQRGCRADTEFGTRGRPWHGGSPRSGGWYVSGIRNRACERPATLRWLVRQHAVLSLKALQPRF